MLTQISSISAAFTTPLEIGTTSSSLLWLLPLAAAISIVYKAVKLPKITAVNFIKEISLLFATIVVVMAMVGVALYAFMGVLI